MSLVVGSKVGVAGPLDKQGATLLELSLHHLLDRGDRLTCVKDDLAADKMRHIF